MAEPFTTLGYLEVHGVKIPVVPNADMDKATYVVCALWTSPPIFSDNRRRACFRCDMPLQVRPYVPVKLLPVCMACLLKPTQ